MEETTPEVWKWPPMMLSQDVMLLPAELMTSIASLTLSLNSILQFFGISSDDFLTIVKQNGVEVAVIECQFTLDVEDGAAACS